jgi:glycerophosphoryl diester phosphodiesterase
MPAFNWLIARPVAHRGLHDARAGVIENTPSAFAAAVAANYAIECDLQVSADGEAMVHHDDALGRLTDGSGRLDAMASAALRRVAFKATADRMISLGDLCDLVGGRVTLVIELKAGRRDDDRLAARAASVLSTYRGPCAVMSFDPSQMAAIRAAAPKLTRGIVAERWSGKSAEHSPFAYARNLFAARPQFIAYSVKVLPALVPLSARRLAGMPLLTWTVRSAEDRARAARFADQMIFEGFRP